LLTLTTTRHYKGWKSSWDEWIHEERAHKMSPENLAKQAELQETARQARMKGGSSGKLQDAAAKKDDKPKKRRRESIVDKV
jgi:mortality factor 4-like protein 1